MGTNLSLDKRTGLLRAVRQLLSPHCDERPAGSSIELLVVHGISLPPGQFGGPWIDQLFAGTTLPAADRELARVSRMRVSAHALIRRDGSITQYVPFTLRAWHAGQSVYRGREQCNDFSIGVELEGTDELAYEAVQYERLAALARLLMSEYPAIHTDRIVGHSDVAPGRKSDPGPAFDWPLLRRLVDEGSK
ncbi:MAG: 1,6-anhydro-N-acetylmuramyl-L-alanine amidase AmpD [Steroidobacteraceae bacterium]